ncbi:plasmid mobilization protein [Pararhizobium mangrovi]|uniref:MobC family plasmid mobilization relaxosome protein n=1 Tax=Pararhizobium mangrovi TaxID=2590452 RepID=A0A506TXE8_9HYPH|nr:MobC family plasmid mobilization relaxosome protein [Pararhizobium mangrovi]TPW25838.1 MobC family plasmid mobilization relaxosome protein [Pararhizobium mangrovi]
MTLLDRNFCHAAAGAVASKHSKSVAHKRRKTTRDCPRVTIRFSSDDFERLQSLADGMTLSVYIRAKALGEELKRRKQRSSASVADKAAVAEILGLLGESRIANNLNQLAYHANVGTLTIDDEARFQIDEAYRTIFGMRTLLLKALGQKG